MQCKWMFTKTLFPLFATKKRSHIRATVTKMRFVGSNIARYFTTM